MKGCRFLGSRDVPEKGQHIYLFRCGKDFKGYAWVDAGGKSLETPRIATDFSGESAYVLTGDIHTFPEVGPGDGVVILSGATPEWLKRP